MTRPVGRKSETGGRADRAGVSRAYRYAISTLLIAGLLVIGFFAVAAGNSSGSSTGESVSGLQVFAILIAVASASMAAGAVLGLLFGIPRRLAQGTLHRGPNEHPASADAELDVARSSSANELLYAGNSNLEQVSDWLTKILIGAGLTQLGQVPGRLKILGASLASGLGGGQQVQIFAVAVMASYFLGGFLLMYFEARLQLPRLFSEADSNKREIAETRRELSTGPMPVPAPEQGPLTAPPKPSREDEGAGVKLYTQVQRLAASSDYPVFTAEDYRRLGQWLFADHAYNKSAESFEKAAELDQTDVASLVTAGGIKGKFLGDLDGADKLYYRALSIDSNYAHAFYNLACSEARRRNFTYALDQLERAFTLEPRLRELAREDEVWRTALSEQYRTKFEHLIRPSDN